MTLQPIGATALAPQTFFLWAQPAHATVECTELAEDRYLVRAATSYRLRKRRQDRESWTSKLHELNRYLHDTFANFQLSLDYTQPVTPEVTGIPADVAADAQRAPALLARRQDVTTDLDRLSTALDHGLASVQDHLQARFMATQAELDRLDADLAAIEATLDRATHQLAEWDRDGVMLAYLFTVTTDPAICSGADLAAVIDHHLQEIQDAPGYGLKQILQGSKFQLYVEAVTQPRILTRLAHAPLLQPAALSQLSEAYPELEADLRAFQRQAARQYQAYAVEDLATAEATFEEKKATPARAVDSLLQGLEAEHVVAVEAIPNDGPLIGYVDGTHQPFGIDPADGYDHFYINGVTRSGKSVLFRVFVETCASLGYDVLSLTPSDREGIGAAFPNQEASQFRHFPEIPLAPEDARGLTANQYWPGHDCLLDLPDDLHELFHGVNVVTLDQLAEADRQAVIAEIFTEVNTLEGLVKPLFVFLDEAHRIEAPAAVTAVTRSIRETAKHDVHVVLSTQNPMDLSHHMKDARLNLTTQIFFQGTDKGYIDQYNFFNDAAFTSAIVNDLERGQAIFSGIRGQNFIVNVRPPLSHVRAPSLDMIEQLDARLTPHLPADEAAARTARADPGELVLSEEQEALLTFVANHTRSHGEEPSRRDCWDEPGSPFGTDRTFRVLDELVALGCLTATPGIRGGNDTTLYAISDSRLLDAIATEQPNA